MTADRAWVRHAARWVARVDAVKSHLNLVFQGMTGVSLASGALKYFGLTWAVGPFIVLVAAATLGYAYLYAEGGVWNQVSRDRSDMSNNFATPRDVIDDTLIATGVFAAINDREPDAEEQATIEQAVRSQWEGYRDGISLEGER